MTRQKEEKSLSLVAFAFAKFSTSFTLSLRILPIQSGTRIEIKSFTIIGTGSIETLRPSTLLNTSDIVNGRMSTWEEEEEEGEMRGRERERERLKTSRSLQLNTYC